MIKDKYNLPNMPYSMRLYEHTAIRLTVNGVDGILFSGGAEGGFGVATKEQKFYNPETETFTTKKSLPTAVLEHSGVLRTVNGNCVFAGGSMRTTQLEYNPNNDTFTTMLSLTIEKKDHAAVYRIDNDDITQEYITYIGDGESTHMSVIEYSFASNIFETKANLPHPMRAHTAEHLGEYSNFGASRFMTNIAGGYKFDGKHDFSNSNRVVSYDGFHDIMSYRKNLPINLYNHAATIINDHIIYTGGVSDIGNYKYEFNTEVFTQRYRIKESRQHHTSVLYDGEIILSGGLRANTQEILIDAEVVCKISGPSKLKDAPENGVYKRILYRGELVKKHESIVNTQIIETSTEFELGKWYDIPFPKATFYNLPYGEHVGVISRYYYGYNDTDLQPYHDRIPFTKENISWQIVPELDPNGYIEPTPIPFKLYGAFATRVEVMINNNIIYQVNAVEEDTTRYVEIDPNFFGHLYPNTYTLTFKIIRGSKEETEIDFNWKKITFNAQILGIIPTGYNDAIPENTIHRKLIAGKGVTRVDVFLNDTELLETSTDFVANQLYPINITPEKFYTLEAGENKITVKYIGVNDTTIYTNNSKFIKNNIIWGVNINLDPEGYVIPSHIPFYITGATATKVEVLINDTIINTFYNVTPSTPQTIDGITQEIFNNLPTGNNTLKFKIYRGGILEVEKESTISKSLYKGTLTGIDSNGYIQPPQGIKRELTFGEGITKAKIFIGDKLVSESTNVTLNTVYNVDIPGEIFYYLENKEYKLKVSYYNDQDQEVYNNEASILKIVPGYDIEVHTKPEGYYYPEPFEITLKGAEATRIDVLLNEHEIGQLTNVKPNVRTPVPFVTREVFRKLDDGYNFTVFDIYRLQHFETTITYQDYKRNVPKYKLTANLTQANHETPPTITYELTCDVDIPPDNIRIYLGTSLIKETVTKQDTFTLDKDIFTSLSNGTYDIRIDVVFLDEVVVSNTMQPFTKQTTHMEIISKPIRVSSSATTFQVNMDIKEMNDSVEIQATNNGYDDNPVWEDIKSNVLEHKQFILMNSKKNVENPWGFRVRINAPKGPFKMSELITGGYSTIEKIEDNNKPTVMKTFKLDTQTNDKLDMKISILEEQTKMNIKINKNEQKNLFKEYYKHNQLSDDMVKRLNNIGIDVKD